MSLLLPLKWANVCHHGQLHVSTIALDRLLWLLKSHYSEDVTDKQDWKLIKLYKSNKADKLRLKRELACSFNVKLFLFVNVIQSGSWGALIRWGRRGGPVKIRQAGVCDVGPLSVRFQLLYCSHGGTSISVWVGVPAVWSVMLEFWTLGQWDIIQIQRKEKLFSFLVCHFSSADSHTDVHQKEHFHFSRRLFTALLS